MALDDDIAILAAAPLFGSMNRDAQRLLCFAGDRRSLSPGETLFARDEPADGGFVVLSGRIELAPRVSGGEPVSAGRSALIGRNALILGGRRPTSARATEPSEVMRITPALMRRVLVEFPEAAAAIRETLAAELAELNLGLAAAGRRFAAD
ncbi:cyclic nucleotide-binding domain-containing protein [Methylobacterium sp. sgz302541]|uniref:cyclic nucleotide-binding domain-containing protein n=1 Tax=unclassified Methylobacterium TaxID=2615210 RepID=UPI003D33C820